jgi:hypothetical protein
MGILARRGAVFKTLSDKNVQPAVKLKSPEFRLQNSGPE